MKKRVSFTIIIACLCFIISCDKKETIKQSESTAVANGMLGKNLKTISIHGAELYTDVDFLAMYKNDTILRRISEEMIFKYPEVNKESLLAQINSCTSVNDMRDVYIRFGITEGNQIVDLTVQNFGYLQSIAQKYPALANLNQTDLQHFWQQQWKKVPVLRLMGTTCAQQYAISVRDCNDDYVVNVGIAAAGSLFAGPAAVATFAVGLAGAIITHNNCIERAKRVYDSCK
ncbi:hypothetical protein DBR32_08085 [Taibaiella sp. KBW10]|uniref:hypothetical protein n=1 Tax=Taibaiella sp. KBW10 TaxID=2153357 RepID=UPI000F59B8BF|nr:hypothetical protein [Taibaiella sp. KBW10]RQO30681.1 hypothetical protein DBR32_08085 [Taibaiella sp. KBW10]